MPASDVLITNLPVAAPSKGARFFYVEDPSGSPAARGCASTDLLAGILAGGNIRVDSQGYLTILVEGLGQYYQIRARLNDDNEAEMYLQAPTAVGGEGGEAIGGEGGELIGQE